jgi:hypothetical protein
MIKNINSFDIWILKIKWTDKIRNEDVWKRAESNYSLFQTAARRKWTYAGHVLRGSAGENTLTMLEGHTKRMPRRGRPRRTWMNDWSGETGYLQLKRKLRTENFGAP